MCSAAFLPRAQTSSGLSTRDGPPGAPTRSGGPRLEPVRAKATTGEQLATARGSQKPQEGALNPATLQRPAQLQAHSQHLLQETGQAMAKEVQRMRATQEQLQQSSTALEQTEASYNGQTRAKTTIQNRIDALLGWLVNYSPLLHRQNSEGCCNLRVFPANAWRCTGALGA